MALARHQQWTFLVLLFLGTSLATLGSFSIPVGLGISGLWPGILVQVLGGIWFGPVGVMAGWVFPIFSNLLIAGDVVNVLGFIPANVAQALTPWLAYRLSRRQPEEPGGRAAGFFAIWGAAVPGLLGGALGAAALLLAGRITSPQFLSVALDWGLPNLGFALLAGYPLLRVLTPVWRENALLADSPAHGALSWRRPADFPMVLKLLLGFFAVGVAPFLTLAVIEIIQTGGTRPYGVNLVALFVSLGTVASLLAAGYLSQVLTRPLKALQHGVEVLTDGGDVSLATDRRDEVGQLAVSFQRLLDERRRATATLRQQEEQLRMALEAAGVGVWSWDLASERVTWSEGAARLFGVDPEELDGSYAAYTALVHPEDRPELEAAIAAVLEGSAADFDVAHRLIPRQGPVRWLQVRGKVVREGPGAPARLTGVAADLTGRLAAEALARASQERFVRAFRSSPLAMTIARIADGMILEVNDEFERASGYAPAEAVGRTTTALGLWQSADQREQYVRAIRAAGEVRHLEMTFRRKSGELRSGIIDATVVEIDGAPCALVHVQDVTETRRLREHLQQSQKMEALGRLAGGVAHDFNNLLTAILGYSDLLAPALTADADAGRDLDEIRKAGRRAAALTQQLLAFSRKQVVAPAMVDLNAIVTELDGLLQRLIGEDIEVTLRLDPALSLVRADAGQMHQALMNLAVNARDAMPRGGRMTITTAPVSLGPDQAARLGRSAGDYARISVQDTGVGMAPEVAAHVFEPFYTTKESGKGTGLGLSTVYGIMQQSGGAVAVDTAPGRGSTFHLYLPASAGPVGALARPEGSDVPAGTERVLVAEDEEGVRSLLHRTLTGLGYRVVVARDGLEAFDLWDRDRTFDLLVTDIVMPRAGGRELAERIRAGGTDIPILFISGYADDPAIQTMVLGEGGAFLEKPFTPDSLARAVRQALDAGTTRFPTESGRHP